MGLSIENEYLRNEDGFYVIDDMVMDEDQFNEVFNPTYLSRNAVKENRRWPNGIVPYKFDDIASDKHKKKIPEVLKEFNQKFEGCLNIRYYFDILLLYNLITAKSL